MTTKQNVNPAYNFYIKIKCIQTNYKTIHNLFQNLRKSIYHRNYSLYNIKKISKNQSGIFIV